MKQIFSTKMQKIFLFGSLFILQFNLSSQEAEQPKAILPNFRITGSVDIYFRTNFNGLNTYDYETDGESLLAGPQAPATAFASDPGFSIGMANLVLGYEKTGLGFVADLVFGPRGEEAVFLSTGSSSIVNQLYVFYSVSKNLRLTLGNFNTFLGYEVVSPVGNFHYSTSYMFSYGPFSHTGLKADMAINSRWSFMLAILNPTDHTELNPSGLYTFGGQLGYSHTAGTAYLNVLYGEQAPGLDATLQADLTVGWNFSKAFYLGINATYNTTNEVGYYGAAVYPQLRMSQSFAIGFRGEYFRELNNTENETMVYGPDVRITDFTLTGSYTVGDLTFKPEVRLDKVGRPVFLNQNREPSDQMSSFLLAAVYSF